MLLEDLRGARGHLGLPSHTLATVGQSGGFLLLESGSTEPLGFEENTCLHFHGFDVGLLLFFACGEGRTKGLSAELQEWLRGLTLCPMDYAYSVYLFVDTGKHPGPQGLP